MFYRFLFVFSCWIVGWAPVLGQKPAEPAKPVQLKSINTDSVRLDTVLQHRVIDSLPLPAQIFDSSQFLLEGMDSSTVLIAQRLEQLTADLNKLSGELKRGLDTLEIHEELPAVLSQLERIRAAIFNSEVTPSLRALSVGKILLLENSSKIDDWQKTLNRHNNHLMELSTGISTGFHDEHFDDTVILKMYAVELVDLRRKWKQIKIDLKEQGDAIASLTQKVTSASILTADLLDEINHHTITLKRGMLNKTEPYLWHATSNYRKGLGISLVRTFNLNWTLFSYYLSSHWVFILFLFLLPTALYYFIRHGIHFSQKKLQGLHLIPVKYLVRSGLACAALMTFTLSPFVSVTPPAIFIEISWFAMLLVATRLAAPDWSDQFLRYWMGVVLLFFLVGFDNLLTRETVAERWLMLGYSCFAIFLGLRLKNESRREPARYPAYMPEVMWLFIGANIIAVILNVFGRFTFGKLVTNSAVIGVAQALAFYLLEEILMEALYLVLEGFGKGRLSAYFHYSTIKLKFRKILIFIGVVLWIVAFLWSLNIIDIVLGTVVEFLEKDRSLGNIDYTVGSIAIFLFVFWCAFTLSNVLRILFNVAGKNPIGSRILLVRLAIITIGFILAMGAAGIPLDKLAIIIGALGVGIGFGLQNIVNNLVSGIILAFEKPMDIGDSIEIGIHAGRVKEIGIRSSKIVTADGANIIVPNGDFISQRLTNWSNTRSNRRVEMLLKVAYGTDLHKAESIVHEIVIRDKDVVPQPPPSLQWYEIANNAVSLKVYFWTFDFENYSVIRSRLLKEVYEEFNVQGIETPLPQQDLHLKSIDPDISKLFEPKE